MKAGKGKVVWPWGRCGESGRQRAWPTLKGPELEKLWYDMLWNETGEVGIESLLL